MNGKKLSIIIIILSLIVVSVGGYIAYNAIINKEEQKKESNKEDNINENTTNDEALSLSLDDEIVKKLYAYVSYSEAYSNTYSEYYFYKNKELNSNNFGNKEKFLYAFNLINYDEIEIFESGGNSNVETKIKIPYSTYGKALKKLFGDNVQYDKNDISGAFAISKSIDGHNWISIKYDESNNSYVGSVGWVGGSSCGGINKKLIGVTKVETKIILVEEFLFINCRDQKIYADYENKILIGNVSQELQDNEDEYINKYMYEANLVTYTFELGTDDEYHFVSSQVAK